MEHGWTQTATTVLKEADTTQRTTPTQKCVVRYRKIFSRSILAKETMLYGRSLMMPHDTIFARISFRLEHHDQRGVK